MRFRALAPALTAPFFRFRDAPPVPPASARVVRVPSSIASADALFSHLAGALSFPGFFGHNWDALDECLRDLSWLAEKEVVFLHDGLPALTPRELAFYLDALLDGASALESHGVDVVAWFPTSVEARVRSLMRAC